MKLTVRFKNYLIGFGIGLILVYVFFSGRLGNWFPNDRVLLRLSSNPYEFTERTNCLMECYRIVENDLSLFLETGDVNFADSEPRTDPNPIYIVEGWIGPKDEYTITFEAIDTTATKVLDIVAKRNIGCPCD